MLTFYVSFFTVSCSVTQETEAEEDILPCDKENIL